VFIDQIDVLVFVLTPKPYSTRQSPSVYWAFFLKKAFACAWVCFDTHLTDAWTLVTICEGVAPARQTPLFERNQYA